LKSRNAFIFPAEGDWVATRGSGKGIKMTVTFSTLVPYGVVAYFTYAAACNEFKDTAKAITASDYKEDESIEENVSRAYRTIERIRRVTWRISFVAATLLSIMLLFQNIITANQFLSVGISSWVAVSSALAFRSYTIEDQMKPFIEKIEMSIQRRFTKPV
jgi:hypothetical protein